MGKSTSGNPDNRHPKDYSSSLRNIKNSIDNIEIKIIKNEEHASGDIKFDPYSYML